MSMIRSVIDQEWSYFIAAIMFYTRIPAPKNAAHSDQILNRSRKYFPAIGYLVGGIAVLTFFCAHLIFNHAISVMLSMVATILATGAFHEDGFADSCDGLGGGWSKEQVLTIMKDSRLGTYATIGLLSLLGLKFLTLLHLSETSLMLFASLYIGAHTISRKLSSLIIEKYNYVQDLDVSKVKPITDRRLVRGDFYLSCALTLVPYIVLLTQEITATLVATATAISIAVLFAQYVKNRIGGYTGDTLGAVQQLSEVFFYLGFLVII